MRREAWTQFLADLKKVAPGCGRCEAGRGTELPPREALVSQSGILRPNLPAGVS